MSKNIRSLDAEWLAEKRVRSELVRAISHVNRAQPPLCTDDLDRCRYLFDALNSLWNAAAQLVGDPEPSERSSIKRLFREGMAADLARWLFLQDGIRALAEFRPYIQAESVLRDVLPGKALNSTQRRSAEDYHSKFARDFGSHRTGDLTDANLHDRLGDVLYVIRNNIQHGNKTPYGPDPDKAKRDNDVSRIAAPVLDDCVEALFGMPSQKLACYGTLRPGAPNHGVMAEIPGRWWSGDVRGARSTVAGLPAFRWDTARDPANVDVLESSELPKHWAKLDEFEGASYRRSLVPMELLDGHVALAQIYEGPNDS